MSPAAAKAGYGHVSTVEDVQFDQPEEVPQQAILDAIRVNPKAIVYCVMMTIGPLIYGFDTVSPRLLITLPIVQRSLDADRGPFSTDDRWHYHRHAGFPVSTPTDYFPWIAHN